MIGNNEGLLIFIASNGHPIPANWNFGTDGDGRFYPLAQEVAKLGGYWETIVYLTPSDTFSLVGAAPPPSFVARPRSRARESSSVYPAHPSGELHGVLARGRGNYYSPINADTAGTANLDFYDQVLALAPANAEATFPALDQTQLGYFQTISNTLCPDCNGNVRNNYGNTNNVITNYLSTMQGIKDPNGPVCSQGAQSDFCQVWTQINNELKYVNTIQGYAGNLAMLGTDTGINNLFDLINTWQTLITTMPPTQPTAPSLVSPIVNLVLGVASAAPTPLAPLFGLADAFFNFGENLATDPKGNQTASLAGPVANLAQQAQNNFTAQLNSIGVQFDLIYQNWPRMQALGNFLQSGQGKWTWTGSTAGQISAQMNPAIKQSMYQSLMAATYAIGWYVPNSSFWNPSWGGTPLWSQPSAYYVYSPNGPIKPGGFQYVQPFATQGLYYAPNFAYVPFTYPTDSTNPSMNDPHTGTILADGSWLAISLQSSPSDTGSEGHYDPPDGQLLGTLFTPVGQTSPEGQPGLGVYRPAFFEDWPLPHVTCTPSGGQGSPGGCNWNSGAPPLEALPPPSTNISIKVDRLSGNGSHLEVRLTIRNTGSTDLTSMEISHIALRTLEGSGDAKLLDSLPIQVEDLAPDTPNNIVVHLEVPQTVSKLALTETGTIDSGTNSPDNFSLSQVITPN